MPITVGNVVALKKCKVYAYIQMYVRTYATLEMNHNVQNMTVYVMYTYNTYIAAHPLQRGITSFSLTMPD